MAGEFSTGEQKGSFDFDFDFDFYLFIYLDFVFYFRGTSLNQKCTR
jgi:hypothetical protein